MGLIRGLLATVIVMAAVSISMAQNARQLIVTEDVATAYVENILPELADVSIQFLPDEIRLSGLYRNTIFIELRSMPSIVDNRLRLTLTSIQINGEANTNPAIIERFEALVNQVILGQETPLSMQTINAQADEVVLEYVRLDTPLAGDNALVVGAALDTLFAEEFGIITSDTGGTSVAMSDEDSALLSRTIDKLSNADSFRFNFNGVMQVTTADEFGTVQLSGRGIIQNFDSLQDLRFEQSLTLTFTINNEAPATIIVDYRIIDGTVYLRGFEPATQRSTRWIGVPLQALLDETFAPLAGLGALPEIDLNDTSNMEQFFESDDFDEMVGLLEIAKFFETQRTSTNAGNEAQFTTVIDVGEILDSPEMLQILLTSFTRFGGSDMSEEDIAQFVQVFPMMRQMLIPTVRFEIDRFINLDAETLDRIEIDFELVYNTLDTPIDVELATTAQITGYNVDYNIEVPSDVYFVENLDEIKPEDVLIEPDAGE
jgi:hypothetical protein